MAKIKKKKMPEGMDSRGKFAKGNKFGTISKRPAYTEELKKALQIVEKDKKKTIFVHLIERAFKNDAVLSALFKKLVPDLSQVQMTEDGKINVTFDVKDMRKKTKIDKEISKIIDKGKK